MNDKKANAQNDSKIECGIVMPIASMDGISASHWEDVKSIIQDSLSEDFEAEMVSISSATDIIHKTIIQNLAEKPIVVCDVSCKNANVMFELGMRLAFNKPVVIIKDDKTDYTFDAGIIEHLEYPRDLRHNQIEDFKLKLAKKVLDTHTNSLDKNSPKFLDNFGKIDVSTIGTQNIELNDYIVKELQEMNNKINKLQKTQEVRRNIQESKRDITGVSFIYLSEFENETWEKFLEFHNKKFPNRVTYKMIQVKKDVAKLDFFGPLHQITNLIKQWEKYRKI